MRFYIDPGTGSMLFTVLIGVLGAAIYALRGALVKLRFLASSGKRNPAESDRVPFAIFTDSGRYESIFGPICEEMEKRKQPVLYLTADEKDPMLQKGTEYIHPEFAGEGNRAFARMNMLKADVVLSSTPGLDVYQWKRSRDVKWYVHVLHAANSCIGYRMFGIDYYDALILSGDYQKDYIRRLEEMRGLPEKEMILAGLPHMDSLKRRLEEAEPLPPHPVTVALAPSWGPTAILSRYGGEMIDRLLETGYQVIVRPHPQSFQSEKELIDSLRAKYPDSAQLRWDANPDNFETLRQSDILISDFSGVMFDYTLVFGKPIIYADVSYDDSVYDAWWLHLGAENWTFRAVERLGAPLTRENLPRIGEVIDQCLHSAALAEARKQVAAETWANAGHSAESIADYLISVRDRGET